MANEGSTKPTYSELEAENLRVRGLLQRIVSAHTLYNNRLTGEAMAILADTIREAAESSLYQANGDSLVTKAVTSTPVDTSALLSMATGFVRACAEEGMFDTAYQEKAAECLAQIEATLPQSSSLVSQGAESADIGKLDRVDKSACTFCGKPRSDELHNAGAELLACSSFTADDYHKFAGSAETGGEKA